MLSWALVIAVQGVFFNLYFFLYFVSPKLVHRIVGYLEEEAIHSYTEFLKEIDGDRRECPCTRNCEGLFAAS